MSEQEAIAETARRIRVARLAHHESQAEVAAVMGIPRTSYCQLENGKRGVGALELAALCEHWGVPYAEMFVGYETRGNS